MELIEIGQIVNTHGIRGEIKLNPWTDDINDILDLDVLYLKNGDVMHIEQSKIHKNCVIIRFSEIPDMNTAERLKGTVLFTEKTELPEGRYYIADLLGMQVFENDVLLGKIQDVFATGANDVYDIKTPEGKSILIPVIENVILSVDVKTKRMEVSLPAGLLDVGAEE